MPVILGLLFIIALAVLPSLWVRAVIARHSVNRPDLPGTGGELARHLLDGMGLPQVKVEETALGDHYDPELKAVRLMPDRFHGRSLSAAVIAAHEVGHAMQDATDLRLLKTRTRLAKTRDHHRARRRPRHAGGAADGDPAAPSRRAAGSNSASA